MAVFGGGLRKDTGRAPRSVKAAVDEADRFWPFRTHVGDGGAMACRDGRPTATGCSRGSVTGPETGTWVDRPACRSRTPLVSWLLALLSKTSVQDEAMMAMAAIGGHPKSNGEPGWKFLGRRSSRLLLYERGFADALRLTRQADILKDLPWLQDL